MMVQPQGIASTQVETRCVQRIVVLRALQLGDLLVAVPALRALRERFPKAEITLVGLPWARGFVQRYERYVDRFLEFPGYPGLPEQDFDEERLKHFIEQQRAYGYDIAIQMHGSGRTSNAFVQSLGAERTVGYYLQDVRNEEGGVSEAEVDLTLGLPYPDGQAEILRNLALVALLGCKSDATGLEFPLTAADEAEMTALLPELPARQQQPWIGVHPGARAPARRWPVEYFAQVADALAERWDARIVFTGGMDEAETVQEVVQRMHVPALNLAGRTSLGALAALLARLQLFISNDTGPAHLACAVDCASIVLFGPAEFSRWAPLDQTRHVALRHAVACSPCGYRECPIDHRCLRGIAPEMVLGVAEGFLQKQNRKWR